MRDYLARTTSTFVHETARSTTPLVDTATEDWVLRNPVGDWMYLRRGQDYYDEGALIWLRADTIIREKTQDRASLDDFLRNFLIDGCDVIVAIAVMEFADQGGMGAVYRTDDAALGASIRTGGTNFD